MKKRTLMVLVRLAALSLILDNATVFLQASWHATPRSSSGKGRHLVASQHATAGTLRIASGGRDRGLSQRGAQAAARDAEAQQLLRSILEVVSSAGPEAGLVRSFQAARATVLATLDLVRDGEAATLLDSLNAVGRGENFNDEVVARALRRLFERLGATYIKLGQFIASSPTLFPEAYVREFQKCLDQTKSLPFSVIKKTVEAELGRPLTSLFRSFNSTPLASASVAQVHAAVLPNGDEVVVKVQKPGVQQVMEVDLGFLYIAAKVLEFLNPEVARTSLVDIIGEIRTSMLGELDFNQELKNQDIFRAFLKENNLEGIATAPKTYPQFSGQKVLTMERFFGVPLIDLEGIRSYSSNPEGTLINALNVWALSVRNCELFHADVHAGNLLVLKDGRIGFIDFGIVGRVPPKIWTAVENLGTTFTANDDLGMARALIAMGATDVQVDERRLADGIANVLSKIGGLQPEVVVRGRGDGGVTAEVGVDENQITDLVLEIVKVTDDNGLKLPREFALLVKQALYFDRYTKLLAPELDPLQDERVNLGVRGNVYGERSSDSPRTSSSSVIDV